MDSIRNALTSIKALLAWLPNPAVAAILLALAMAIAFLLHRIVRKLIRRLLAHRAPFVFSIFTQMRGVTQLGLVILAIIIAIPVAPVDSDTAAWMTRLVLIGMIGLVGWGR
jgi:hypothetical protein